MATTVFGYGSLISETSLKQTCPSATNIRLGLLKNYKRVFSLVSISRLKAKLTDINSPHLAAVAVRPSQNYSTIGILFEIPSEEIEAYLEREHRYEIKTEKVKEIGTKTIINAMICIESSDQNYKIKCGTEEEFYSRVGQHYSGSLWHRKDILPIPQYINLIREACFTHGLEVHDNFIESSFTTIGISIKDYLQQNIEIALIQSEWQLYALKLTDTLTESYVIPDNLHVTHLYLDHNFLSNPPSWIFSLQSIQYLTLHNNQIESLAEEIGLLKNLLELRLDNNKLKHLPSSIGDLKILKLLNLSGNLLQTLPDEIGNLSQLIDLGIEANPLHKLPFSLTKLKNSLLLFWGLHETKLIDNGWCETDFENVNSICNRLYLNKNFT